MSVDVDGEGLRAREAAGLVVDVVLRVEGLRALRVELVAVVEVEDVGR